MWIVSSPGCWKVSVGPWQAPPEIGGGWVERLEGGVGWGERFSRVTGKVVVLFPPPPPPFLVIGARRRLPLAVAKRS